MSTQVLQRVFSKTSLKRTKDFEIKAAAFEGELLPAEDIDRLATLPTYDEALSHA